MTHTPVTNPVRKAAELGLDVFGKSSQRSQEIDAHIAWLKANTPIVEVF